MMGAHVNLMNKSSIRIPRAQLRYLEIYQFIQFMTSFMFYKDKKVEFDKELNTIISFSSDVDYQLRF